MSPRCTRFKLMYTCVCVCVCVCVRLLLSAAFPLAVRQPQLCWLRPLGEVYTHRHLPYAYNISWLCSLSAVSIQTRTPTNKPSLSCCRILAWQRTMNLSCLHLLVCQRTHDVFLLLYSSATTNSISSCMTLMLRVLITHTHAHSQRSMEKVNYERCLGPDGGIIQYYPVAAVTSDPGTRGRLKSDHHS